MHFGLNVVFKGLLSCLKQADGPKSEKTSAGGSQELKNRPILFKLTIINPWKIRQEEQRFGFNTGNDVRRTDKGLKEQI